MEEDKVVFYFVLW